MSTCSSTSLYALQIQNQLFSAIKLISHQQIFKLIMRAIILAKYEMDSWDLQQYYPPKFKCLLVYWKHLGLKSVVLDSYSKIQIRLWIYPKASKLLICDDAGRPFLAREVYKEISVSLRCRYCGNNVRFLEVKTGYLSITRLNSQSVRTYTSWSILIAYNLINDQKVPIKLLF